MTHDVQRLVTELVNAQIPNTPVVNLIKELKQRGYKIYLFSNIGTQQLQDLITKLPDIFTHFDGFHPALPELDYAKKPSKIVFESFLKKFNPNNTCAVIFIDDKMRNIKVAEAHGMIGIQYVNPTQLSHALKSLLS
jgi:FMN phosphatase YigB (HAD superfamily)